MTAGLLLKLAAVRELVEDGGGGGGRGGGGFTDRRSSKRRGLVPFQGMAARLPPASSPELPRRASSPKWLAAATETIPAVRMSLLLLLLLLLWRHRHASIMSMMWKFPTPLPFVLSQYTSI